MARYTPKHDTAIKLSDVIDLLIDRAPALRGAGVLSFSTEGFSFALGDPPPPTDLRGFDVPDAPSAQHIDPLKDPSTFPGGRVPGFKAPPDKDGFRKVKL